MTRLSLCAVSIGFWLVAVATGFSQQDEAERKAIAVLDKANAIVSQDPMVGLSVLLPDGFSDEAWSQLAHLKSLARIEFSSDVTDDRLKLVANLEKVKHVSLKSQHITDAGLKHLSFKLPNLESLELKGDKVTDTGLKVLSGRLALKTLILECPKLTDDGLKHLQSLANLKKLTLESIHITDSGLKELQALKRLEFFDLQHRKVTKSGIQDLEKAIPKLKGNGGVVAEKIMTLLLPQPFPADAKDDDVRKVLRTQFDEAVEMVTFGFGDFKAGRISFGDERLFEDLSLSTSVAMQLQQDLAKKADLLEELVEMAQRVEAVREAMFKVGASSVLKLQQARFNRLGLQVQLHRMKGEDQLAARSFKLQHEEGTQVMESHELAIKAGQYGSDSTLPDALRLAMVALERSEKKVDKVIVLRKVLELAQKTEQKREAYVKFGHERPFFLHEARFLRLELEAQLLQVKEENAEMEKVLLAQFEAGAQLLKHGQDEYGREPGNYLLDNLARQSRLAMKLPGTQMQKLDRLTKLLEMAEKADAKRGADFKLGRVKPADYHRSRFHRLEVELQLLRVKSEVGKPK